MRPWKAVEKEKAGGGLTGGIPQHRSITKDAKDRWKAEYRVSAALCRFLRAAKDAAGHHPREEEGGDEQERHWEDGEAAVEEEAEGRILGAHGNASSTRST